KPKQLGVRDADRLAHRAVYPEGPLLRIEPRHDAQVEPRPFPDLPLSRREMPLRSHRDETIEIPRYKSLCLTFEGVVAARLHDLSSGDESPHHLEKTCRSNAPTKV